MYKITIPESSDNIFESVFEPNQFSISKLRKDAVASEGMIDGFRGKKNRVAVGQPYKENLISRMQETNEEISHEIKKLSDKYDFHFVSMTCVFKPDTDCKFDWAGLGIELYAIDSKTGQHQASSISPIAYSLFPDEVSSEIKTKREISVTPELRFNILSLQSRVSTSTNKTQEYIVYEPQIVSFGLNTSSVAWDFKSTKEKAVLGDKRLQLVIQTPRDTKVKGRFVLGAEVS
jgi:hypothetical protein